MWIRRAQVSIVMVALAVIAAACTSSPGGEPSPGVDAGGDLLALRTGEGTSVFDPSTGKVTLVAPGAVALPDWSAIVTTTSDAETTTLATLVPSTGGTASSVRVRGDLAVRVVSGDGRQAALMEPIPAGADPWTPEPRAVTDIVVADPTGRVRDSARTERFHLKGNFEPEAFSPDGEYLYLIRHLPPLDPTSYRVAALYLENGKVWDVISREKAPVETMTGTRLSQVMAPDGSQLYTLYTNQPPEYAQGFDAHGATGSDPVAFVHVLSLEGGWAHCAILPPEFGPGDIAAKAIASGLEGKRLYAIDVEHGRVAVVNTESLEVMRDVPVEFDLPTDGVTAAQMGPGGTLFVGRGDEVVALGATTLEVTDRWMVAPGLEGLAVSGDGQRLYAAAGNEIHVLDPASGAEMGMTPAPEAGEILQVVPLAP